MQTDSNLCSECGARSSPNRQLCPACSAPVVLDSKGSIEIWRLGEIRPAVLNGMVRTVAKALGFPVIVQPSFLDPRPSQREEWNGISATAFLNQIDRRSQRGSAFSVNRVRVIGFTFCLSGYGSSDIRRHGKTYKISISRSDLPRDGPWGWREGCF